MGNQELRERIREIIKKHISDNCCDKKITKEGIVGSVLNHIGDILKKQNDKRFQKNLEKLAKSSPEGKKAANHLVNALKDADDAIENVDDILASLGFEK